MVTKVPPKLPAQQTEVDIRAIPLCIMCAKEEEMGKVAEAFCLGVGDWFPSSRVIGYYTTKGVYVGSFKAENGVEISYFITCCSRQGIQTFGIEASALFTVIKPQYALLIGTCAAREGKGLSPGDVIFGQCALNYEEGKVFVSEDGVADFKPDALPLCPEASKNYCLATFVARSDQKRYKYGAFASGCGVRLDAQSILGRVSNEIKRDVLGLEMEASAFIQACIHTGVTSLGVIKGASDLGDFAKGMNDDQYWHAAINNAAKAAKQWVTSNIKFDISTQEEQPGYRAAKAYFTAYVQSINQWRHDLWLRSGTIPGGAKGLKVILPMNNNVQLYGPGSSVISVAIRKYGITCVCVGTDSQIRTTLFKAEYLVDFPRTMSNALADCRNSEHQAGLFEKCLRQLCEATFDDGEVEIFSWEQFKEWAAIGTTSEVHG